MCSLTCKHRSELTKRAFTVDTHKALHWQRKFQSSSCGCLLCNLRTWLSLEPPPRPCK